MITELKSHALKEISKVVNTVRKYSHAFRVDQFPKAPIPPIHLHYILVSGTDQSDGTVLIWKEKNTIYVFHISLYVYI